MDALRMIAVLLMIASHTSRLIVWDERRDWSRFSLLIEPLTASLFLILVGASLAHSWLAARERARAAPPAEGASGPGSGSPTLLRWYRKQAVRAGALWAVSCLFYTLEDGFRLPDALTMSGILATIAYTILLGTLLVTVPWPIPALTAASAALAGMHAWLDTRGLKIFAVNAGNSPMLPLFLFACLGALGAFILAGGGRAARAALALAAVAVLAMILQRHSFAEVFTKPVGRFETVRTLVSAHGDARVERIVPYYNLRPILVPVIASLIILLYAALAAMRPLLDRAARYLLPLGRRSLDVYILHLSLLAVLVVLGGKRPLSSAWQGDAVLLAVIALCYLWVLGRDVFARRRRARA